VKEFIACLFFSFASLILWEFRERCYCSFLCLFLAQVIPLYVPDTTFQPTAIEMVEGQTSPPQLLTEADLISLMEKHGIGTVKFCTLNI